MSRWSTNRRVDAGRLTLLASVGAALVLVGGCESEEAHTSEDAMGTPSAAAESPTLRYGTPLAVPGGTVRTYLLEEGDRTLEVGIAIDEGVMNHLPDVEDPLMTILPDGHALIEWELDLPEGNPTPFRHATLDWNPMGHEPPGVYDVPHFDVHFYTITSEEREAILPVGPEFEAAAAHHPSPEFVPAGYVDPGMPAVPRMGVHWIDPTSPELHPETPEPFTRTFIYGTWDGRLTFVEPMVATNWLATRPDETIPVPVAERYEPEGLWPGAYRVYWDAPTNQYRIALADLAHR
jgi:hypothetical protein